MNERAQRQYLRRIVFLVRLVLLRVRVVDSDTLHNNNHKYNDTEALLHHRIVDSVPWLRT